MTFSPTSLRDSAAAAVSLTRKLLGTGRLVALAWLTLLVVIRAWDPVPLEILRLQAFDQFQRWQPRPTMGRPVMIVDIDEASLAEIGQWPWPRTVIGNLVAGVFGAGAVSVGFDMVFAEPDRMSPAQYAQSIVGLPTQVVDMLTELPSNDQVLAEILRGNRVVLGRSGTHQSPLDGPSDSIPKTPIAELGFDSRPFVLAWPGLIRNLPVLEQAAVGFGMFNVSPEKDGIVRRVPAVLRVGDALYPSLSIELLRVTDGQDTVIVKANEAGVESVSVGTTIIPTDRNGRVWIRFNAHDPARYVSAKDVLSGNLAPDAVAGKIVLVGTSATGLLDIKSTPLSDAVPGVEVMAQLLETILTQAHLTRPTYAIALEMLVLVFAGLLLVAVVPILGAFWTIGLFIGVAGTLTGTSWYLFGQYGVLIDAAYPSLASISIYGLLTFANYTREQARRRQIREAFNHYLSPELVEQVARNPSSLVLGGESRELTILFSDIHDFTAMSERYDAPTLTWILNRIFDPLSDTVLDAHGTIDKYIGDSLMAFWNAPLTSPTQARDACLAALAMAQAMDGINDALTTEAEREGKSISPIKIGVGVNTGMCCVGNMGSEHRFNYSAIGDPVNLASRLEGQTRGYRVPIIIGENTFAQAKELAMLELDLIRVKGKTVPARIYTLLGDADYANGEAFSGLLEAHDRMLAAYRGQDWSAAEAALKDCRKHGVGLNLDDLYDMYDDRFATYEVRSPGSDWDGVFVATIK